MCRGQIFVLLVLLPFSIAVDPARPDKRTSSAPSSAFPALSIPSDASSVSEALVGWLVGMYGGKGDVARPTISSACLSGYRQFVVESSAAVDTFLASVATLKADLNVDTDNFTPQTVSWLTAASRLLDSLTSALAPVKDDLLRNTCGISKEIRVAMILYAASLPYATPIWAASAYPAQNAFYFKNARKELPASVDRGIREANSKKTSALLSQVQMRSTVVLWLLHSAIWVAADRLTPPSGCEQFKTPTRNALSEKNTWEGMASLSFSTINPACFDWRQWTFSSIFQDSSITDEIGGASQTISGFSTIMLSKAAINLPSSIPKAEN